MGAYLQAETVRDAANGKWLSIFDSLGIEISKEGRHSPCPIEGAGVDRFLCDNKDGTGSFYCNNCGAGDGISLVRQCLDLSFPDTLKKIASIVGIPDEQKPKEDYDPKPALNKLWKSSTPLRGGDPVSKYLHSRGIMLTPENVRYAPECWESDTKKKLPAMVARFVQSDGKPCTLHRTYLNGTGKADVPSPKKLMKGTSYLAGGAIRLFPILDVVGIAEGIETAISATQLTDIPCWSVVSSTLMKSWQPPEGIKKIVIFADNDANFCGQQAAYTLANRLYSNDLIVNVEFSIHKDWNDDLQGG